ncbi:Holliday junction resolvase [Rhizobium phage vB_RleS_L338C]|uniref:Holliday junction resolvase n=1 Tax=Rhizobium phage vB_RleS_L338C TaxID=1414737 RepID=UPI0003D92A5E|nr:Holliday junction resolvase [Rhizobium phage vB_RleS_L338C]AHC30488.1 hypothetical protein L338C_071 [Rhizobium phage vB_RleS_L338C]QNH72130.1 hypothetical protein P11VFA_075 [Rhizobium phage P11VFA]
MALATPKRLQAPTPSHARSKVQEKTQAKRVGGKVTTGSGNKYEKGDVRLKGVARIEAKTTKNSSYSVTKETIRKLEDACFGAGEIPILHVELELGNCKFVVMPDYALDMVLDVLREKNGTA